MSGRTIRLALKTGRMRMKRDSAESGAEPRCEWEAPTLILIGDAAEVTNLSGANVENFETSDS